MKVKHVYERLFGVHYVLAYGIHSNTDIDALGIKLSRAFSSKVKPEYLKPETDGYCDEFDTKKGLLILIVLKNFQNSNYYKGILGHECFHATGFALKNRGIKFCENTEEVYAYNVQFLIEFFLDEKRKKRSSSIRIKASAKKRITPYGKRKIAKIIAGKAKKRRERVGV